MFFICIFLLILPQFKRFLYTSFLVLHVSVKLNIEAEAISKATHCKVVFDGVDLFSTVAGVLFFVERSHY